MSELSPVYEGKVAYEGLFDFKDVYRFLYEWFKSYDYLVLEKKYSEKIKAEGKDVGIEWLCLRKISDYFRFRVKITIRILHMATVELARGGTKIKKDKGEMEIKFNSFLERDWENRWEVNPVTKFFRGIYDKYIITSRIEAYEDRLVTEVDEVIAQAKSFLALEGRR
ncbi:MAG: hypothetical protein IB618_00815 [Candidatus Pacearchaeota archaeon]|nr:MAG: hypothetical protein IB618_00815 [Candidatus Pacearchaeota archaeon]